ncbi:MAG: RNA-directed DNA polymerase [Thermomicrobiales bacterium]|nr:RNA-directed DNA polymerase [Thermomicrobiales bacterium]
MPANRALGLPAIEHRRGNTPKRGIAPTTQQESRWRSGSSIRIRWTGDARVRSGDGFVEPLDFRSLDSADDVARMTGLDIEEIRAIAWRTEAPRGGWYRRTLIPKRQGGFRLISTPIPRLAAAQRRILAAIGPHFPVHPAATAFRLGMSVRVNAACHTGRPIVVRIDLADFFSAVRFGQIHRAFECAGCTHEAARILASLTSDVAATVRPRGHRTLVVAGRGGLPQGACTSPVLANAICWDLDEDARTLGRRLGFTYTRYADDLVFSAGNSRAPVDTLIRETRRIIQAYGFHVNEAKTRVMRAGGRQVVTGLVVNGSEPRVPRPDLRRFRAFLHHCETEGLDVMSERIGKDALNYARGYLAWVHMVSPEQAARFRARHPWLGGHG